MNAVKVGTCRTCTHAVCTGWPSECCDPGHNALRRKLMGVVATIVATCFEKVVVSTWSVEARCSNLCGVPGMT